jgi:hypothetical protein
MRRFAHVLASLKRQHLLRISLALMIAALAFALRNSAAQSLPSDFDEPTYLAEAQAYGDALRRSDFSALQRDSAPENPQLMKLMFGAALSRLPQNAPITVRANAPLPVAERLAARQVSVGAGALHVLLIALLNPLAGALLAIYGWHIKFTSEVMLEAAPLLFSALSVASYRRWLSTQLSGHSAWRWLALSAVALGLTAAGKYLYCICGIAVLMDMSAHALRERKPMRWLGLALVWGITALAAFVLVLPYLWPDPVNRLAGSVLFHASSSKAVANTARFVWWQPAAWLFAPPPWRTQPYFVGVDGIMAVLALLGVLTLWQRARVYGIWLLLGLVFLFLYANKLQQYTLMIATPLCLAAGEAPRTLLRLAGSQGLNRLRAALSVPATTAGLTAIALLGGNPHLADPAFREATAAIQARIKPDEIAFALIAAPYVEGGMIEPGWQSWNTLIGLQGTLHDGMFDYTAARRFLSERAAGRHGIWLLTQQRAFGDPGDTLRALVQRQTATNGPSFEQTYDRDYAVTYFRLAEGYTPIPDSVIFSGTPVSPTLGTLVSHGCAQLRPVYPGGVLELTCQWRSAPYEKRPWNTAVELSVLRSGHPAITATATIARSGYPYFHFEGVFAGVYLMQLPPDLPAGDYALRYAAFSAGEQYSAFYESTVRINQPP